MTQKKSSKEPEIKIEEEEKEPEIEVRVEDAIQSDAPTIPKIQEPPKEEEDITFLKSQLADLRNAQEASQTREREAERRAQQAVQNLNLARQSAEQSQYDSIVTAMGAAQIEVDAAKRDIVMAGTNQDYPALADAQERLSAAKSRMISLEAGKDTYERRPPQHDPVANQIDNNPALSYEEKGWLKAHPDSMSDPRKNAKLNAAYFDAMDKGLQRGTAAYFNFIEEQMGYKAKEEIIPPLKTPRTEEEDPVVVAAPPSRESRGPGGGTPSKSYTLSKDEAEIARLSGISPADYVREKLKLQALKKDGYYTQTG